MKDLQALFERAKEELDVIGIEYGNIVEIKINTRAKRRWGQCQIVCNSQYWKNRQYSINISDRLLQDDVKDEACLDTIIHEILHTCDGCMNHGCKWKELAELVNECYACYNIQRCSSSEEKGIECKTEYKPHYRVHNYAVRCSKCGYTIYRERMSNLIKYPHEFKHTSDGGKFERLY